jgi:hypothetical protein
VPSFWGGFGLKMAFLGGGLLFTWVKNLGVGKKETTLLWEIKETHLFPELNE